MRVLIADDHEVYRAGLSVLLKKYDAVGDIIEVSGFDEALDRLAEMRFTVALFDLEMPGMAGSRTLSQVRAAYPDIKLAIISANSNAVTIDEMLAAGADIYIPKSTSLGEMAAKLRNLLDSASQLTLGIERDDGVAANTVAHPSTLTPRQVDVLNGIARGMSNKEIARQLGIAPGTVKIHLAALFEHFGAGNRTDLLIRSKGLQT